ncbi:MAG: hypothetical protein IT372_22055 [Polyangiaceae bacterium]|nr:hypothetical protein [Polyangiaceae bacterium]
MTNLPLRVLIALLGLTTLAGPPLLGCSKVEDGGGTGQGGEGQGGSGGGGAAGSYCGENSGEGPLYCGETETCHVCKGDWGGPQYDCRDTPVPAAGEFACFFGVCTTATEYCTLDPSPWCVGDFYQGCEPLPASCGAEPDCACLEALPCVASCEVSAEGGLIVELEFQCAP